MTYPRKLQVFDQMTTWPVSDIVQKRRGDQNRDIFDTNRLSKARIVSQTAQKKERQTVDTKRMFETGVSGAGIDQRDQAELGNFSQTAKLRRVDNLPYPRGQRNIEFRGDAD